MDLHDGGYCNFDVCFLWNSQKNKVQSGKQVQEPVGTVVEESEVVVEVDSITPDSTTRNTKR